MKLRLLFAILALAIGAAACGGEDSADETPFSGASSATGIPDSVMRTLELAYQERCTTCGAVISVGKLEILSQSFRVQVTVENTGEAGALEIVMDKDLLYAFDSAQATRWEDEFAEAAAAGGTLGLIQQVAPDAFPIYPTSDSGLPRTLRPGQAWTGWFESRGLAFPSDTAAILIFLGPVNREKPTPSGNTSQIWVTYNADQPFIRLKGDAGNSPTSPPADVTITSISNPLARGQQAAVSATTAPGAQCSIKFTSALGGPIAAPGLGSATADASGNVSWSWTVPDGLALGESKVEVSCGGTPASASVSVVAQ